MKIYINSIKNGEISFEIEPDQELLLRTPHKFDGLVKVDGNVDFYDGDKLQISFKLWLPCVLVCDRCGMELRRTIMIESTETFAKELDEEEDYYLLRGSIIELDEVIRNIIAFNFPTSVLCKEDCKGVCSVCGNNLNLTDCGCKKEVGNNNPFADLFKRN